MGSAMRTSGTSGNRLGLFALSNRMAHLTNLHPNPEFFTMGR